MKDTSSSEHLQTSTTPNLPTPGPQRAALLPPPNDRIVLDRILGAVDVLSEMEQAELLACETVIEEGWGAFLQVGLALARIQEGQLYRAEFDSFQAYYRAKWDFERAQVYYLIGGAQAFARLASLPDVPKPDYLSQLRPLIGLGPEAVETAWRHAASTSGGRKVTARLVKRAVQELRLSRPVHAIRAPTRQERSAQREAINGLLGDLLNLISHKAAHDLLLEKVQILDHHLQRLFALDRKR